LDRTVPFTTKLILDDIGLSQLLIRSFHYFEVLVGVKLRFHNQPSTGGCQGNEVDDHFMAEMRFSPPVVGDAEEEPMVDLVP
jgi:hypothetical protein